MALPPVEYIWRLALQPTHRPACYEDDPMQAGISTGPPWGGCWLTNQIEPDERWGSNGDSGDGAPFDGDGGGGRALIAPGVGRSIVHPQIVVQPAIRRAVVRCRSEVWTAVRH